MTGEEMGPRTHAEPTRLNDTRPMQNGASGSGSRSRSAGRRLWWAHVAALVLVSGYIGLSLLQSTPDANIGLGLGLLALSAMGLPWTLPVFWHDGFTLDSALFAAVATGGALANLLLHALVRRRRAGRGPSDGTAR